MITTGTPVSIALVEWLTWYANQHMGWFDKSSQDFDSIEQFLLKNGDIELESVQNFLKFTAVLMSTFDGGFYATNIQSVFAKDTGLAVQWFNSIRHEIALSGWDRGTRQALNYMFKRLIGFDEFLERPAEAIHLMHSFLQCHHENLNHHLDVSYDLNSFKSKDLVISESLFAVLSSLPIRDLETFYIGISALFPDEYHFDGINQMMSAKAFFARPVNDALSILDKVKMQYNFHFHSISTLPFVDELSQRTVSFVQTSLSNPATFAFVENELKRLNTDQLSPKLALLALILDHYRWKT